MQYVMSDLHGCYEEYMQALKEINFTDDDILYVDGDVLDRGPEPIRILQDMMMRTNVYPLLGNHEFMALQVLRKFGVEITDESIAALQEEDLEAFRNWMNDGGETTVRQFCACSEDEREMILEYLEEFSLIEETEAGGREYVIVHAGLEPFDPDKDLQDYDLIACIFWSPDPDQRYYEDRIVISGHTPTLAFPEPLKGKVIEKNGHVLIDCGCVFGGSLAVYCLDNGQVTYIPAKKGRR